MNTVAEKIQTKSLTVAIVESGRKFHVVYLHKLMSGKYQSTACSDWVKVADDSDESIIKAFSAVGAAAIFNTVESATEFVHIND